MSRNVPCAVERFGKDHWSLLAYVEALGVDGAGGIGTIDRRRLRCNPERHQGLLAVFDVPWQTKYGTRLSGFFEFNDHERAEAAFSAGVQLEGHDDWDCLDDLESAGFLQVISATNGTVRMSESGLRVVSLMRAHKARGGNFAGFRLDAAEPASAH